MSPGQSEIAHGNHYTLEFEHEIGGSLGSGLGSGMSRSGTTTTGSGSRPGMGSGSGLIPDGTHRRVLIRNESSARQGKGKWEKVSHRTRHPGLILGGLTDRARTSPSYRLIVPPSFKVYEDLPPTSIYRNDRRHRHPGQPVPSSSTRR
jgi:hypothetical protein